LDDDTPSLAIALYKPHRGRGLGTQLMLRMLSLLSVRGCRTASLAVQKANYAVKMYEKVGFKTVEDRGEEWLMRWEEK
ncbi:MAG: GNAT family N-acetyltransferase, partial [Lachnospiraceae bacterium]|nr:GNAT family N-acetyltransferase [Lachnospiraceae bacterium]